MLSTIRDFFERNIGGGPAQDPHSIELATAALLVEAMRIDAGTTAAERDAVQRAIRAKFGLAEAETDALIALAEEEMRQATDYYQFTSLINQRFSQAQKERVLELMWRVAYADADLSAHENHLMRKVADLLHVTHGEYIAAKMRAQAAGR